MPDGLAYWGDARTMVSGSIENVTSEPYQYNAQDKNSPYYRDFQQVYDLPKGLTHEQKRLAKYFDDPAVVAIRLDQATFLYLNKSWNS